MSRFESIFDIVILFFNVFLNQHYHYYYATLLLFITGITASKPLGKDTGLFENFGRLYFRVLLH